jgi:putative transposase
MPRRRQEGTGGLIFHVINRGAKRAELFSTPSDYRAFENLVIETKRRIQISLLAYCLMPNHWHLVLWPDRDGSLSKFMQLLTFTHAMRWNASRGISGAGAVYQGRFKAIPVQHDWNFLRLCRYVERNPLRAGLVKDPAEWRWSSFWCRLHSVDDEFLAPWPTPPPEDWHSILTQSDQDPELEAVRKAVQRGQPLGTPSWCEAARVRLRLTSGRRGRLEGARPAKLTESS